MDRRGEIGGAPGESSGALAAKSPYPGLRSFAREEAEIFFGRDRCISGMTETLQDTRFLAVLGPSGSGKSSLVRSGLFMHLEAGLAREAGARWTFLDIKHPRTTPFAELARLTLESEQPADPKAEAPEPSRAEIEERRKALSRDPFALVRWWTDRPDRHPDENLLLLVDQFEELFGYSTDRERNEVEAFIDLLLESARQEKVPVYVVITMRSEFLGGCSLFPGLAEQINASLSLTPRMTREECREAITGPAYGGDLILEDVLVTAILNDMNSLARFDEPGEAGAEADAEAPEISQADLIARRADQLPLMQHVLNWMWNIKATDPARDPDAPIALDLEQYLKLGRLRGAMNLHADDVMAGTGDSEAVARIFRALTDQPTVATSGSAESSAVRRRRTVAQLAAEADVHPDRVRAIVDAYRAEGVSMLNPDPETYPRLEDGDEVDISHESLIRQWNALRGWIREEAESGRSWQELLRDVDKGALIAGLDLAERRGWWDRTQPHAGWADRYAGRFAEVDEVMKRSVRREQRRKILLRTATAGAVGLAVVSVASVGFTQQARQTAARALADAEVKTGQAKSAAQAALAAQSAALAMADDARTKASAAKEERDAAKKAADAAKRAADAARTAAAAASRQTQLARLQVSQAEAAGAAIRQRSALLSNRIAERAKGQLGLILGKSPSDAVAMVSEMGNDLALLRDADPSAYAAIQPDLERKMGELAANRIDTTEMVSQANVVRRSIPQSPGGGNELDAVRLSQADLLEGRAESMAGDETAALASFDRASEAVGGRSGEDARLAKADALYERAALLLDSPADSGAASDGANGRAEEALEAARQCLSVLPADTAEKLLARQMSGEAGGDRLEPAMTRALVGQVRCHTILGSSDESEAAAAEHWKEAATSLMFSISAQAESGTQLDQLGAVGALDLSQARSDLIVRYFRRQKKPFSPNLPEELEFAVGMALTGLTSGDSEGNTIGAAVEFGRFYPLDALHRMEANNALMSWYVEGGGVEQIAPPDALMIMKINQGLMRALPSGQGGPGLYRRVSDAFFDHASNWMELYGRLDSSSSDDTDDIFGQVVRVMADHWNYLAALPSERLSGPDRSALEGRLRTQAQGLIERGRANVRFEPYRTLLSEGRSLAAKMCGDGTEGDAECRGLRNAVEDVARANAQFIAAVPPSPLAGASPEAVWTDSDKVALGGWDPVTCFDSVSTLARPAQSRVGPKVPTSAARKCSMRKGRLEYALRWGDQVWLFEREVNRTRFQSDPSLYTPRLGGYDLTAIRDSGKDKQSASRLAGTLVGRRLYLTQNYAPASVTPEDIRKAEENWLTLKSAPEVDSGRFVPVGGHAYSTEDGATLWGTRPVTETHVDTVVPPVEEPDPATNQSAQEPLAATDQATPGNPQ